MARKVRKSLTMVTESRMWREDSPTLRPPSLAFKVRRVPMLQPSPISNQTSVIWRASNLNKMEDLQAWKTEPQMLKIGPKPLRPMFLPLEVEFTPSREK